MSRVERFLKAMGRINARMAGCARAFEELGDAVAGGLVRTEERLKAQAGCADHGTPYCDNCGLLQPPPMEAPFPPYVVMVQGGKLDQESVAKIERWLQEGGHRPHVVRVLGEAHQVQMIPGAGITVTASTNPDQVTLSIEQPEEEAMIKKVELSEEQAVLAQKIKVIEGLQDAVKNPGERSGAPEAARALGALGESLDVQAAAIRADRLEEDRVLEAEVAAEDSKPVLRYERVGDAKSFEVPVDSNTIKVIAISFACLVVGIATAVCVATILA